MSEAHSSLSAVQSGDELGQYRSLYHLAVVSLVLGVLSILAFAPAQFFIWIFPPSAIVTGLLALRRIRSAPEVWTGLRLAQCGVALGIVCATGGTYVKHMDTHRISSHGRAIADRFVEKLRAGDVESAFWLTMPRESRRDFENKSQNDIPMQFLERYGIFRGDALGYSEAMARGEARMEFESVESATHDRGADYAVLVYKYLSPQGEDHVLIVATSYPSAETLQPSWYIREHRFAYTPRSYAAPASAGHGHSH